MKTSNMVPEIYYSGSRDFSFIARLYEIALNYMKSGADIISNNLNSEDVNSTLIDLLCNTLGFTIKHKYINKDLISIASVFSHLVKWKGSEYAINEAVKTLLNSQEIKEQFSLIPGEQDITLILPPKTKDIILLEDLFDYILPAGMLISINYSKIYNVEDSSLYITTDNNDLEFIKSCNDYVEVYNSSSNPLEICLSCYLNGNLVEGGYFKDVSDLNIDPNISIEFLCDGKNYRFEKTENLWVSRTTTSDIEFDNYLISEGDESITKSNYSIYKGNLFTDPLRFYKLYCYSYINNSWVITSTFENVYEFKTVGDSYIEFYSNDNKSKIYKFKKYKQEDGSFLWKSLNTESAITFNKYELEKENSNN